MIVIPTLYVIDVQIFPRGGRRRDGRDTPGADSRGKRPTSDDENEDFEDKTCEVQAEINRSKKKEDCQRRAPEDSSE